MATRKPLAPSAPIALLTDYGRRGPYVAALKGVIFGINPSATVFDISHDIAPQAVEEGALVLAQVVPFLPDGTICLAVVDPGVGTARKAIALLAPRATFVGPDNGLVGGMLEDDERPATGGPRPDSTAVPTRCRAAELSNPAYLRQPVSATFHGRDIFAPIAAHLSLGVPVDELGLPVASIQAFPAWRAQRTADGSYDGRIIWIDWFGNLVTDIRAADLPSDKTAPRIQTTLAGVQLDGLQRTFQDGPEYIVYAGSGGFLEIGRRNGSAAVGLGAKTGDTVRVLAN